MPPELYAQIDTACQEQGLVIYGALHPARTKAALLTSGTLILLGTAGGFWPAFTASAEHSDTQPDSIDRWSLRVVGHLAERFAARAYFPFGGPPFEPFVNWALASGRAFTSPSQLLVHDAVGLLTSYRGALHLDDEIAIPAPALATSPCIQCTTFACINTCPAHALVDEGPYQVAVCHEHLETIAGTSCLSQGCAARLACPISVGAARDPAQSAHHMRYFHPR